MDRQCWQQAWRALSLASEVVLVCTAFGLISTSLWSSWQETEEEEKEEGESDGSNAFSLTLPPSSQRLTRRVLILGSKSVLLLLLLPLKMQMDAIDVRQKRWISALSLPYSVPHTGDCYCRTIAHAIVFARTSQLVSSWCVTCTVQETPISEQRNLNTETRQGEKARLVDRLHHMWKVHTVRTNGAKNWQLQLEKH